MEGIHDNTRCFSNNHFLTKCRADSITELCFSFSNVLLYISKGIFSEIPSGLLEDQLTNLQTDSTDNRLQRKRPFCFPFCTCRTDNLQISPSLVLFIKKILQSAFMKIGWTLMRWWKGTQCTLADVGIEGLSNKYSGWVLGFTINYVIKGNDKQILLKDVNISPSGQTIKAKRERSPYDILKMCLHMLFTTRHSKIIFVAIFSQTVCFCLHTNYIYI